jgi:hypothetical protein
MRKVEAMKIEEIKSTYFQAPYSGYTYKENPTKKREDTSKDFLAIFNKELQKIKNEG